jgi:beta-galactosidase/beta-glucuronidase
MPIFEKIGDCAAFERTLCETLQETPMRFHWQVLTLLICLALCANAAASEETVSTQTISLDETWLLATDSENVGRQQQWSRTPRPEARQTRVPWIIQEAFPGYHGVAWYWRAFTPPANPHVQGRYLLKFWAVDYLAEVWLNGVSVGGHEGGEGPFVLDVTAAIKPGK